MDQENLMCPSCRMVAELVFDNGSTSGCFGHQSETDGGSVGCGRTPELFAERAPKMVGTQTNGSEKSPGAAGLVCAKEIGEPPTSNGKSGLGSWAEDIALHLWGLILWSCLGAFELTIGLFRNVVAKERDLTVAEKVAMNGWEKRLP